MNECTRCGLLKPHLFLIANNPSLSYSKDVDLSVPPEPLVISCKECLTDEEIARILGPVALFVVETALRHTFWHENPDKRNKEAIQHFGYAEAWLRFRCGLDPHAKEKSLKALTAMIGENL